MGLAWVGSGLSALGAVVVGSALLIVLLAHAVATVWRGGTAWVIVDLIALAVAIAGAGLAVAPLLEGQRGGRGDRRCSDADCGRGRSPDGRRYASDRGAERSDRRRQHRVFTSVMWSLVLPVCLGSAAYSAWLMRPSAEDLVGLGRSRGAARRLVGRRLRVGSRRLDVEATFAFDLDRGKSFRLDLGPSWAADRGVLRRRACRRLAKRDGDVWRIRHADLNALPASAADSPILLEARPRLVLSPAGDRLATIEGDSLVVTELASGDLIGAARLQHPALAEHSVITYFADRDHVRVLVVT